jgi:glutaredoxin-related protein
LKKNHIRKQRKRKRKRKKTHVEKHYNNPQCFVRKTIVVILNQLNIKKIKSTKIILKKIIKKNIKTMWKNTVAIHNVLKKKTTKLNS